MSTTDGRCEASDGSLRAALEALPDVRRGQGKVHPLGGLLALAVCALLCGCRSLYASSETGPGVRTGDPRGAWATTRAGPERGDAASGVSPPRPRGLRAGARAVVRPAGPQDG